MALSAQLDAGNVHPVDMGSEVHLRLGLSFPVLMAAYCIWKSEGNFPLIFYKNPEQTLWEWIEWNYQPTVEPVGCYVGERMVGIGWINQAHKVDDQVVAEIGVAFYKGTALSIWHKALDLLLRHAFIDRGFHVIYGLSDRRNQEARMMAEWCGMKETDQLPWAQKIEDNEVVRELTYSAWRCHRDIV